MISIINRSLIRFFDFIFALAGLIILFPFFVIIGFLIYFTSKGGVIYKQKRVGIHNCDFFLLKFRTMKVSAEQSGLLTVGNRDSRITGTGYFLRRFKLDELPQLINVLKGEMSLVGPRPEVRKYVDLYSPEQMKVLSVKPGITDLASILYFNENEILGKAVNPEKSYIEEIMPAKISINMKFIEEPKLKNYFMIIFKTLGKILSGV
jgi:lipopolysaccharide/colanic/teichoic acid biosynthesis glycosyltransferase